MSVTLVHPAKVVRRNEMPFCRDIHMVPSKTVLDGPQSPIGRGDLGVGTPVLGNAAYWENNSGPLRLASITTLVSTIRQVSGQLIFQQDSALA